MRAGRLRMVLAALGLAVPAALACTDIVSDPTVPVAIELDPTPLPSIVLGDSLRDSLGRAVPLSARALNSRNEVIPGAPITFLAIDTAGILALDPQTGRIVGREAGEASVVASAGTLQSVRVPIRVSARPTQVTALDAAVDTIQYILGQEQLLPLRVRVMGDTNAAILTDPAAPVQHYLVRFVIVDPAAAVDTNRLHMVDDARRPSTADTTNALGEAGRQLRFPARIAPPIPDSVVVEARVRSPNQTAVPGSPVVYVVKLRQAGSP